MASRFIGTITLLLLVAGAAAAQCPSIAVIGPSGLTEPGGKMIFRVDSAIVVPEVKYNWTVSAGTIVQGQGTPAISVSVDRRMAGNITATAHVEGLPAGCKNTASESAPVAPLLEWESIDSWGDLRDNNQRSRLDTFFAELANNPHNIGLVVLLTTNGERRDLRNRRIQLVMNHVRFRKFDAARIWFCLVPGDEKRITIYRFPPGLEGEIPYDNCMIIKGGDIQ